MKRIVELSLEKAREWYEKGGELREVALQAYKEKELKPLTYRDVCKELFFDKIAYYIDSDGDIQEFIIPTDCIMCDSNSAVSVHQLKKLLALNKLVNVAKFLNSGWEPDWNNKAEKKWMICLDYSKNKFLIWEYDIYSSSNVYFKTEKLAWQAINILGEETIKLAITENW